MSERDDIITIGEQCLELEAYEVVQQQFIKEINCTSIVLQHKKSGARIMLLPCDDENKVFNIVFRTTPEDSTGMPHIIEHSVLCGSKNFPLKDPFVELAKGSMNTFLNAMTYPDKTMYPVASCNDKDFQNLMHVYLDAVFYPNIYNKEEIFQQEGWHYELENLNDSICYNGVVYNEMKGVFSSPMQQLSRCVQNTILPDTTYGVESGGIPEEIVELSYEKFLDFHRTYYHPSNSYIFLYGDMDMIEKLDWIDKEYLSNFDKISVNSEIAMQPLFSEPKYIKEYYGVEEGFDAPNSTYYTYNALVGTFEDQYTAAAMQVLEYALIDAPGAPLRQVLLDLGLGADVMCSYNNGIQQPYFSIVAKDAPADQGDYFYKVIRDILRDMSEEGLDKKTLQAAVNQMEFRSREADYGTTPKGLVYSSNIMDSWLYDDNQPFLYLCYEEVYAYLKEKIEEGGYFEALIKKYMLDNPHITILTMSPKPGLEQEMEKKLQKKLDDYASALTEQELQDIVEQTNKLKVYQETPDSPELIASLPMLKRTDLKREIRPIINEEREVTGDKVVYHDIFSNGICYLDLYYDLTEAKEYAPYIAFLATLLGYIDMENMTYLDFNNEMNLYTGGISADGKLYVDRHKQGNYSFCFEVGTKVLYAHLPKSLELIEEMLYHTVIDDKRLKEVIAEARSRMEMRLQSSGHQAAVSRAVSGLSEMNEINEAMNGIVYYRFLQKMERNFEEEKENLKEVLNYLLTTIFSHDNMLISCTCDEQGYGFFKKAWESYSNRIKEKHKTLKQNITKSNSAKPEPSFKISLELKDCNKEAYTSESKVQYVAHSGTLNKINGAGYKGTLSVIKTILSYEYLWTQVRVLGGAYGVMCQFSLDGDVSFVSYRDPQLVRTEQVFQQVPAYLRQLELDDEQLTKYVVGTIGVMDTPLTPSISGSRSFSHYMQKTSEEDLIRRRNEVLDITIEDIHQLAGWFEEVLKQEHFCVVGNQQIIRENAELFETIEPLF